MARETVVSLVDDMDGKPAAETVTFALDGKTYEIDLSERNAAKLRNALEPFIAQARSASTQRPTHTRTTLAAVGGSRNALIRAWAAAEGHSVPARGRIPQAVVTAYDASHHA